MEFLKVLLFFAALVFTVTSAQNKKAPITVARTELKVSRSLNPENTQTLEVLTRDGNIAQLIVKKRESKSKNHQSQDAQKNAAGNSFTMPIYTNWIPVTSVIWSPSDEEKKNRTATGMASLSFMQEGNAPTTTKKVSNVIDSDIIPYVPRPVTINSEDVYVKNANTDQKRGRSVTFDDSGIPTIHGVRVPDDENDKRQTWRNARVINGELFPYESGYKPPAAIPIGQLIYASKDAKTTTTEKSASFGPFTKEDNERTTTEGQLVYAKKPAEKSRLVFAQKDAGQTFSFGPFTKDDNYKSSRNTEQPTGPFTVRDNYDDYYYNYNNADRSKKTFGPFTKEDNMKFGDAKLIDYIKEINDKEAKRDYFSNRKYRSAYANNYYDTYSNDYQQYYDQYAGSSDQYANTPQMQRRMLQYPGYTSYPNSAMYSTTKLSPVNFNEGVRTPVLQYAHPELGVQPAKIHQEEEKKFEIKPNRNFDSANSVEYYRKDVLDYPYGSYYVKPKPELPFWMKITESIRDNVQNGLERMQQLTRPVFEPLVEASQKISYNLGLSQPQAQKKMGIIAPVGGGSVILPALGLVAGGAALGLGAAAVGRFLEPNEMRALRQPVNFPGEEILVFLDEENAKANQDQKRYKRSSKHSTEPRNGAIIKLTSESNVEGSKLAEHARLRRSVNFGGDLEHFQRYTSVDFSGALANRKGGELRDEAESYTREHLRRAVRSVVKEGERLQSLYENQGAEKNDDDGIEHLTAPHLWTDTPCSKKLFCDVMAKQSDENVVFMEKKMDVLLSMFPIFKVHPEVLTGVSHHLGDVMDAVKTKDCSRFTCRRRILQ